MHLKGFLRAGTFLSVLNLAAGGLGYVFQVLMGRALTPTDYAVFNAILAVVSLVSAPLSATVMAISRQVAVLRGGGNLDRIRLFYGRTARCLMIIGGLTALILQATRVAVQDFLRVAEPGIMWIAFAIFAAGSVAQVNSAFLQGLKSFGWLGCLGVAPVALKIGFCAVLVMGFQGGLPGALTAVLAATLLVGVMGTCVLLKTVPGDSRGSSCPQMFRLGGIVPVVVAGIAFTILTQFDVALANYFFDPVVAGEFTAAAILGKAVLYLPGGLALALFPIAVENHVAGRGNGRLVRHSLVAALVLCGAAALAYLILGPCVVALLFGGKYQIAGKLLSAYGLAVMPMGAAMVAEHLLIAKGRMTIAWIFLVASLTEVGLMQLWHPSPWAMIGVMGCFNTLLAVIGCQLLLSDHRQNRLRVGKTEF
jgi:O-antigen/teichoic acid export membrane protein